VSKTSKEERPYTYMKSSTKGTRILQAYSGGPAPFELPHRECHCQARSNPWTLEEERILEILDFAQSPPRGRHLSEVWDSSEYILPVEEEVQPQKPQKPGKIGPEDPRRSGSPSGPWSLWRGFKDSGRNIRFSKAKLTILLRKEGFTVSSSTVGRILRYLKTRGLLKEGGKPRKVAATGRRREKPETPCQKET